MATMVSRRSTFGINCAECGNELIAPEKSEYCDDGIFGICGSAWNVRPRLNRSHRFAPMP